VPTFWSENARRRNVVIRWNTRTAQIESFSQWTSVLALRTNIRGARSGFTTSNQKGIAMPSELDSKSPRLLGVLTVNGDNINRLRLIPLERAMTVKMSFMLGTIKKSNRRINQLRYCSPKLSGQAYSRLRQTTNVVRLHQGMRPFWNRIEATYSGGGNLIRSDFRKSFSCSRKTTHIQTEKT